MNYDNLKEYSYDGRVLIVEDTVPDIFKDMFCVQVHTDKNMSKTENFVCGCMTSDYVDPRHLIKRDMLYKPIHITDIYKQYGHDFSVIVINTNEVDMLWGMDFEPTKLIFCKHNDEIARIDELMGVYDMERVYENEEEVLYSKKEKKIVQPE